MPTSPTANETPASEKTGSNVKNYSGLKVDSSDSDYNEHKSDKIAKRTTFYIVRGIPESTKFTPDSIYEIGKIECALVDICPT